MTLFATLLVALLLAVGLSSVSARVRAQELQTSAQQFHSGEGLLANRAAAMRLQQLLGEMGSVKAKRMLALIFQRPCPSGEVDMQWMTS